MVYLADWLDLFCLTLPAILFFFFFAGQRCKWKRHPKCLKVASVFVFNLFFFFFKNKTERENKIEGIYLSSVPMFDPPPPPIVLHTEMAAGRIKHLSQYMQDAHRFSTNAVETSFVFCLWFTGALSFLVVDTISIFSSILTAVTNN